MITREDVYQKVLPYLWAPINKKTGEATFKDKGGPFTWSPTKPEPTQKALKFGPVNISEQDFPNPDFEWEHPCFKDYMLGYALLDDRRRRLGNG